MHTEDVAMENAYREHNVLEMVHGAKTVSE